MWGRDRMSKISRRQFVIKSAEDAFLLYCLGMLPYKNAFGQSGSANPKRLVLIQIPDGISKNFWPTSPSGQNIVLNQVLSPFAGFESEISLVRGFNGSVPSHNNIQCIFTGANIVTSSPSEVDFANTNASLDQYVAEVANGSTPHPSISLGVIRDNRNKKDGEKSLLFNRSKQVINPQLNPKLAIDTYFSNLLGLTSANKLALNGNSDKHYQSIMNLLAAETKKIASHGRLGSFEQQKMLLHAESLAKMLDSASKTPTNIGAATCQKVNSALRRDYISKDEDDKNGTFTEMANEEYEPIIDAYSDLIVAGISCGISNVFTLQLGKSAESWSLAGVGENPSFAGDVNSSDLHGFDHGKARDANGEQANQRHDQICEWFMQKVANLAKRLKQIPEGSGSLLDNTLIVVSSEFGPIGRGTRDHDSSDMGYLLIGGRNIGFASGKYFDIPQVRDNSVLLNTIAKAYGVSETIGRSGGDVSELRKNS